MYQCTNELYVYIIIYINMWKKGGSSVRS